MRQKRQELSPKAAVIQPASTSDSVGKLAGWSW